MKPSAPAIALALALVSSTVVAATPTAADKERCFKEHKQLMHKPAVQNERDCWNTHGYMHKSQ